MDTYDRRLRCPVVVEPLPMGDGRNAWRVSRVFPNAASAECAMHALDRINPEGFVPVGQVAVPPPELVVDEDDPLPGCATGLCGLD